MCFLFTFCTWTIDFLQRAWTFAMSCCVSSAVVCALMVGSIGGVALGYHYSLAEFLELKEANTTVVFRRGPGSHASPDDEDLEWRRSGDLPGPLAIEDINRRVAEFEVNSTTRRQDDSIFKSDDRNSFESLLKLLSTPPGVIPSLETLSPAQMEEIEASDAVGAEDQIRAIQTLIDMRKNAEAQRAKAETKATERYVPDVPVKPSFFGTGRRVISRPPGKAGPPIEFREPPIWRRPNLYPKDMTSYFLKYYDPTMTTSSMVVTRTAERAEPLNPTEPLKSTKPRRPLKTTEAIRPLNLTAPTRPHRTGTPKPTLTTIVPVVKRTTTNPGLDSPKSIEEEMNSFQDDNELTNMQEARREDEAYYEEFKEGVRDRRQIVGSLLNANASQKFAANNTESKLIENHIMNKKNQSILYTLRNILNKVLSKVKSSKSPIPTIEDENNISGHIMFT